MATFPLLVHLQSTVNNVQGGVKTNDRTDEELVVLFRNGHMPAGGALCSRYKNSLYSFCMRMLRDEEAAKDATQETFLKMVSRIHSLEKGESFRSWMFAVARNEVLMVLRRKKIVPMETLDEEEMVIDSPDPLEISLHRETAEKLRVAIGKLKPAYRETYLLREAEGMSYETIARVTGTTVSAVKSKLFKSRVALNEMLAPYMKEETS